MDSDYKSKKDKIDIYFLHQWGGWRISQSKIPRALNSVVLDCNLAEKIEKDVLSFIENEAWYK